MEYLLAPTALVLHGVAFVLLIVLILAKRNVRRTIITVLLISTVALLANMAFLFVAGYALARVENVFTSYLVCIAFYLLQKAV
jgi:ABC-type glycerol-3-phosphate transport system permease component